MQAIRIAAVAGILYVTATGGQRAEAAAAEGCDDQFIGCVESCENGADCTVGSCDGTYECGTCIETGKEAAICRM